MKNQLHTRESRAGASLLVTGGMFSSAIAVLHLVIIYYGAPAYRYFGAGERLARMAEEGSPVPGGVTFGIAVVFFIFAAYAFAAAGVLNLPFAFAGTALIAAIYSLRGLALAPVLLGKGVLSRFDVVSSLISLGIGLVHIGGLCQLRQSRRTA